MAEIPAAEDIPASDEDGALLLLDQAAATGLTPGNAAIRRLDFSGGAGTLEATDDTDNCASDFVAGVPRPRNNGTIYQGHFE